LKIIAALQFLVFSFSWLASGIFLCMDEADWNTVPLSQVSLLASSVDNKSQPSIQNSFGRNFDCGCNDTPSSPKEHSLSHCLCFCHVSIIVENPIQISVIAPPSLYNYLSEQTLFIPQGFFHNIDRPPRLS
jgi:hypothetical protein